MSSEIICPHCKKTFKVDDTAFADILKQVRDSEFDSELHARIEDAVSLAVAKTKNTLQEDLSKRNEEISLLQQKLEAKEVEKRSAITEAIYAMEKERDELIAKLKEKDSEALLIESQTKNAMQEDLAKKEAEIVRLQSSLELKETEKRLAITEAINVIEKERNDLAGKLESKDSAMKLLEVNLRNQHASELKMKDDQIAQYRDFKAKQSVKLLGESLEQHCEIAFRQWQATGAFRNVYFGKDNDISISGTKGDYIYREVDNLGNEILSIMFDMKNEADNSSTKKKNEDHFKKLNQDREKSGAEYAVLVSMLEADSELYTGITDVSYAYDKMYVIRPQFFISMITILRNTALSSLKYKAELALVRGQNIDITNFENELQMFQSDFMRNVKNSGSKFKEAMDGIDKTIKQLEGIKEALRLSNKHLLTAGNKVESVSVKRLTKNNPTMAAKFAELKSDQSIKSEAVMSQQSEPVAQIIPAQRDVHRDRVERNISQPQLAEARIFHFNKYNTGAQLTISKDNEFVLRKGSRISPILKPYTKQSTRDDRALYSSKISEEYVTLEDIVFKTPTRAAVFVSGGSENGWTEWKTIEGATLDSIVGSKGHPVG